MTNHSVMNLTLVHNDFLHGQLQTPITNSFLQEKIFTFCVKFSDLNKYLIFDAHI